MTGREKGKIPIRKILEKRDVDLYHRIETLWNEAHELQERQGSKEHHQQGTLHSKAVEDNLSKIISDNEKHARFSPLELFLISVSACYHDAGKSDDFDKGHAVVVMRDIYSHPEKYHLCDPEGKVLSYIIGSHDIDEVFNETPETYPIAINEDIHVRLLSALFRLADVLHTDNTRIPHIIVGDAKKEDDKTRFRKLVQGWGFNDKPQIMLTAAPQDLDDINIVAKGVSMMQKQIECIVPILRSEGYPYEITYSCDYRGIKWKAEMENKRNLIEMDFYTENETDIFKGRDIESKGLLNKVIGSDISLLIGNSGVGKTSLIRAGLFPKLSKMGWKCIWTRPVNPEPLECILKDINANLPIGYESDDIISSIKKLSEQYGSIDIIIAIDQLEDILKSPQSLREALGKILLRVYGKSFRSIHILLSYRGDYEPEINSFLDNSGIINPNRFPLLGLDSVGAHDALRSIFETNNVGISNELVERIIKEVEKKLEHGRFHPPFIQIVASSLINLAKSNGGVISEELYNNEAKSVETIIGAYLINRLNEFGDINSAKRINAEAILKELVRDRAKEQKRKDELLRYLNIPENDLQELLYILVNKRLIRHLGNDNYEIIHDYLASRVEIMIKDQERLLRSARDILRTKAQHYRFMPIPSLLETNEMVLLYSMKESINPDAQEKELFMFSYLAGNGPIWWWFREKKEVIRTIIEKALSSSFPNVRKAAVEIFVKLGTHDDFPIIKEMLKDDNEEVRLAAIKVIEKLGLHEDLQIIKEMFKDDDAHVRLAAIKVIEKLGTHTDLPAIKEMCEDDYPFVKIAAIEVFGKLGTRNDLPIIKEMLKDSSKDVREAAISTFGKLCKHEDLPTIKKMLKDGNRNIRVPAVSVLGKLGSYEDLPIIREMLNDRAMDVRAAAVSALGNLGTHDDLPIIKKKLNDQAKSVRAIAISAFGKLCIRDDFPMIKEMLQDFDWIMRSAAAGAFKELATYDDLPIIKEMLQHDDSDIRKAAVLAFVKFGTHDDFELIKELLRDSDAHIKGMAIALFERLVTSDDLPIIKEMLKDEDPYVRTAAVESFEKIAVHDELLILKEMFKDTNSNVREAASNAILKFGKEIDLQDIVKKYAIGEVVNEEAFKCIIELDEKFYFKT